MVLKGQNFKGLAENEQDVLDCILDGLDCRGGGRLLGAVRALL